MGRREREVKYIHANPSGIVPDELDFDAILVRGRRNLIQHQGVRHGQPCGLDGKMTAGTNPSNH